MNHRYAIRAMLALGLAVWARGAEAQSGLTPQGALGAAVTAPTRVAKAPGGRVYVVDGRGGLWMLTPRGEVMAQVALPDRALAVAAGPDEVYVSTQGGKVLRVDPAGARVVGEMDLGLAQGPVGMAYDAKRSLLWVAERAAGRVRGLRLTGTTAYELTRAGAVKLRFATDVAVDEANDRVWVVRESGDGEPLLHRFSAVDGTWQVSGLVGGSAAGQLNRGGGVAVDGSGTVYATDVFAGVVQVVSGSGVWQAKLGSYGTGMGQLRLPLGAALLGNGDLAVASSDNARVERYGTGAPLPECAGDADCDGLADGWEAQYGLSVNDPGNALRDGDGDGLTALEEQRLGTDPTKRDTDGDGVSDGDEVAAGTDPLVNERRPVLVAGRPAASGPGLLGLSSVVQAPGGTAGCVGQWQQVDGPGAVELRGATSFTPSFVARAAGSYRFRGVARCGDQESAPVEVAAEVTNVAPRAEAGRTRVARPEERLRLDGEFSSDANGDGLRLGWEQTGGEPVAARSQGGRLEVATGPAGLLEFRLTASDEGGLEGAVAVPVVVAGKDGRAPTAQVVTPVRGRVAEREVLDGRGSYGGGSTSRYPVSYEWRQVEGPAVAIEDGAAAQAWFRPERAGRYRFELRVERRGRVSPAAAVDVYVAPAGGALPVARAVVEARGTRVGEVVGLDGTGSAAGGGGGLEYRWRQVAGPAAGLTESERAVAAVVPFGPGFHAFELVVKEGEAESVPALVWFTASRAGKRVPVAVATIRGQGLGEGRGALAPRERGKLVLDGRRSTGAARWRWWQVAGPWGVLSAPGSATTAFTVPAPGRYVFELEVDDGEARSAPVRVGMEVKAGDLDENRGEEGEGE